MALRGVWCGKGCPSPPGEGLRRGLDPSKENSLFNLKMDHFGAVFKLNLTEETRTQLQEEEAIIAASCLIQATSMPSPLHLQYNDAAVGTQPGYLVSLKKPAETTMKVTD